MMIIDNHKAGTLFITSLELHTGWKRKTNKSAVGSAANKDNWWSY